MPDQLNPCDLLTSFRFEDGGYRGVLRTRPGKPGLPERVVFWACPHVHAVAGEARSCARAEKDRLAETGTAIDLTAELDEADAIVMGSGGGTSRRQTMSDVSNLYTCPALCDTDCEINGWGCHESHDVPSHRGHDPAGCEARQLAEGLRSLIDAGWRLQFGKHPVPHQGRYAAEPYYVQLRADPMISRIRHGVTPGEAVARARQCAEQEGVPGV